MSDDTKLFGPADAPVIMAWQSHPSVLPHLGTWATTRYPEEAVAYVPAAERDALQARVEALESGLKEIAAQKTTDEIKENGVEI